MESRRAITAAKRRAAASTSSMSRKLNAETPLKPCERTGRDSNHLENAMLTTLFLALGAVFVWLLLKGYSTREIIARGWGIQVRIYQRDSEPIMYWVTFGTYLVLAVLCTVIGF